MVDMVDFDDVDSVIAIEERFKIKLGIGEDAYESLRQKKNLGKVLEFIDTLGAGAAGAAIAGSPMVASTFFPATGLLGFLGIGAAATPIGWVIAAGAAATFGYFGIKRYITEGKDDRVEIIPKWINTPMDVLALALFGFMAPLYLKVAFSDRVITDKERKYIRDYFIDEWGYSKKFIWNALADVEKDIESFDIIECTDSLIEFERENPDCNFDFMVKEVKRSMYRILQCSGKIDDQGEVIVDWIAKRLDSAR